MHTEFLKFGELVNFKVCRNGSSHLRGNVYVHYKCLESAVLAYNSINGRFFAGKQITCEFVGVTRWKVAICGEYMKSRLKTCSHGSSCNFIHCFRNPGGDYEWADWDNPPPKYWVKKMAVLFGSSDDLAYNRHIEPEHRETRSSTNKRTSRYHHRRSRSKEDRRNGSSDEDYPVEKRARNSSNSRRLQSSGRMPTSSASEFEQSNGKYRTYHGSGEGYYDENRVRCDSSTAQLSIHKKLHEHNLPEDMHSSDDDPHVGKYKGSERDSSRYYNRHGNESPLATSSSWRKDIEFPDENETLEEKYSNHFGERYQEKCRSSSHDYEDCPDSNRVRSGSSSKRKKTNSDHRPEQNYDSDVHDRYDRKYRSHDYNLISDNDETKHPHNPNSRRRKRNNSSKVDMSFHDDHENSEVKCDFDDRYDGRYGSLDGDSSGDYYPDNRCVSSNHSWGKHTSSRKKETDSHLKSEKKEKHKGDTKRGRSCDHSQYREKHEPTKSIGGSDRVSDSSWESSYNHSLHNATAEEYDDYIENPKDTSKEPDQKRQSRCHDKNRKRNKETERDKNLAT